MSSNSSPMYGRDNLLPPGQGFTAVVEAMPASRRAKEDGMGYVNFEFDWTFEQLVLTSAAGVLATHPDVEKIIFGDVKRAIAALRPLGARYSERGGCIAIPEENLEAAHAALKAVGFKISEKPPSPPPLKQGVDDEEALKQLARLPDPAKLGEGTGFTDEDRLVLDVFDEVDLIEQRDPESGLTSGVWDRIQAERRRFGPFWNRVDAAQAATPEGELVPGLNRYGTRRES